MDEIRSLDPNVIDHREQKVKNVQENISKTVLDVFGADSPEYHANQHFDFFSNANVVFSSDEEAQEFFATQGLRDGMALIQNLIQRLDEDAAELRQGTDASVRAAFEGLALHPRIGDVSADRYRDKYYADAVLKAALALENYVKERSGREDLSGSPLMEQAFGGSAPTLAFNALADESDRNEQRGFMMFFQGVVFAFRNPRAHTLLDDAPEAALEAIALINFLAKRLEQAKRTPKHS
jgi:uncharacterized protein (TIGR02391 family)